MRRLLAPIAPGAFDKTDPQYGVGVLRTGVLQTEYGVCPYCVLGVLYVYFQ
jgi:hypothetical protein